jgi:hypothetical protein
MANTKTAEICRQMDDVRSSLGADVEEIVASAKTLTDWRLYVKSHPWLSMAGAAALGFLAVPKRSGVIRPTAEVLEDLAKRNKLVLEKEATASARSGMGGALAALLVNAAVRGALTYASQNAGKLFGGARAGQGKPSHGDELSGGGGNEYEKSRI